MAVRARLNAAILARTLRGLSLCWASRFCLSHVRGNVVQFARAIARRVYTLPGRGHTMPGRGMRYRASRPG